MKQTDNQGKLWNRLVLAGLVCITLAYAAAFIKIVMLKSGAGERVIQLIPFRFAADFFRNEVSIDVQLKNVLGNFAIFLPLGILVPLFFRKLNLGKTVLIGFLTSLLCETVQYAFGIGLTDVDDLILNTLGALAGAALYFGLFQRRKTLLAVRILSFAFLAVFGCCGLAALLLYAPSELPARIEIVNEAVLGGVDPGSYDLSAYCVSIQPDAIAIRDGSANSADGTELPDAKTSYALSPDAEILLKTISAVLTPNGNVSKTIVTYEAVSAKAAQAAVSAHDGAFCDLWTDAGGACTRLILTVYAEL